MIFSLLGFHFPRISKLFNLISSSSIMDDLDSIKFEEQQDEAISDSFICCVCLDLLYKPIVLECGHVSCFWCVHKSMDPGHTSHCPICRNPYHYFPTICEVLHFLLVKMYPIAYRRREKQMLEEEKTMGCFSPQLGGQVVNSIGGSKSCHGDDRLSVMPSSPSITKEADHSHLCAPTSAIIKDDILSANLSNSCCASVSSADLLCPACKRLLFCPAVLNCGHVLCKGCIFVSEDGIIICSVCEIPHPTGCPNICLELNNFLEERFPEEYTERKGNVEEMKSQFQHKNPSFCCEAETSSKKKFRVCKNEEDFFPWWKEFGSKVHYAAGCDYCGMFPIVGDRYRCLDCVEEIGFDLCGDCYKTSSKRPGRFNQQHTSDHRLELVKPLELSASLTFQLVGEHIVDSSGTQVMAISALEDSSDGWIAVDSADFQHNVEDNSPVGNHATHTLDNLLGESVPVEFTAAVEFSDDAVEASGDYVDSVAHHDSDMEDQTEDSPSTA